MLHYEAIRMTGSNFRPQGGDDFGLHVRIGETDLRLTHQNTIRRIFTGNHAVFNHCVYIDEKGQTQAFIPAPPLDEALERHQYPVKESDHVDMATIQFMSEVIIQQLFERNE